VPDTNNRQSAGRPRKFDLELGVEKAMRLFWEKGYDGVGVAELASKIGINPPSLYAAYGNKIGLYRRAIEHYGATHGAFLGKLSDKSRPLLEILQEVLRDAVYVYSSDPECKGCLVMSGAGLTNDPTACKITEDQQEYLRNQIRELAADQYPEIQDPVAEYFVFILAGLSARAKSGVSQKALSRTLDHAFSGLADMIDRSENRIDL
jgi:TetR/AcrR family transcriptional repressor for divergent bdcA